MWVPKSLRKYALWLLLVSTPYPLYSTIIFTEVQRAAPKIQTIEEAYSVLNEEKSKLGIEDRVALVINDEDKLKKINIGGFCGRNDEGYVIGADMSNLSRFIISHELYHLFRDKCEQNVGHTIEDFLKMRTNMGYSLGHLAPNLKYYYIQEPRANIYALTGLKL